MDTVQATFRALADPTRRQILMDLSQRDMTIGEVVDRVDITRSAVKKHLTILEQGQLISVHRDGRTRINRLEPAGLQSVSDWIKNFSRFWDDRLSNLKAVVENMPSGRESTKMSEADDSTITKTIFLQANRETVWRFLTDKDKLGEWFHPANTSLALGQDDALLGADANGQPINQCWGTVLEMQQPARLVYSFTVKPLSGAMTTVTWTLQEAYGGTRLTLVHEGVGEAAGDMALGLLRALDAGWDEHFVRLRAASG